MIEWRFGDRPEDADAWLRSPTQLHVYMDFQSPDTPPEQWHRVMAVTVSWVEAQINQSQLGACWPALLIVPDGSRSTVEAHITRTLTDAWPLVVRNALLLPVGYTPPEW